MNLNGVAFWSVSVGRANPVTERIGLRYLAFAGSSVASELEYQVLKKITPMTRLSKKQAHCQIAIGGDTPINLTCSLATLQNL